MVLVRILIAIERHHLSAFRRRNKYIMCLEARKNVDINEFMKQR